MRVCSRRAPPADTRRVLARHVSSAVPVLMHFGWVLRYHIGTVAFGSPYVGAGSCASDTGAVAGQATTGPELNRLEDALGLL